MNQKICVSNRDWMTWINGKLPTKRQRRNCFRFPNRKGSEIEKDFMSWVSKLFICTFPNNCTQTFCYLKEKLVETNVPRKLKKELQSNLKRKSGFQQHNWFFCDKTNQTYDCITLYRGHNSSIAYRISQLSGRDLTTSVWCNSLVRYKSERSFCSNSL